MVFLQMPTMFLQANKIVSEQDNVCWI